MQGLCFQHRHKPSLVKSPAYEKPSSGAHPSGQSAPNQARIGIEVFGVGVGWLRFKRKAQ